MTKDELLAELLVERYAPRPLPPAAPDPLVRAPLDCPAPHPEPRRRGHLVVLDGGPTATEAA
ncbi:hypothetical protein [Micromonospora fulviviridis]|uniref:hypothetical protein n=1 Tax=Micromonospora fulviviridis TaxID=47860 RepID=UPI0037A1E509